MIHTYLRRLFQHMSWADGRVLECLRATPESESLRLFAHLLAAEQVWMARLRGLDQVGLPVWPEMSLAECAAAAEQNRAAYARYLETLSTEALASSVTYRNSTGRSFSTAVGEILIHIAMHGSYHRGQIATRVRIVGGEPVNTDFITFVREHPEAG